MIVISFNNFCNTTIIGIINDNITHNLYNFISQNIDKDY